MTEYEKYLFDLNGYVVLEDVLTPEQVQTLNEAIAQMDVHPGKPGLDEGSERLKGEHGRGNFGAGFNMPEPWCRPFRELMVLPAALRCMIATIGDEFRFEGTQGITMTKGCEGQILHGGGVPHFPNLEQGFYHRFENGHMRNGLMAISYLLSDAGPEDGGFCCIPGSHKANYDCTWEVRRMEKGAEFVRQISAKAGSAILFTEALTHGALPWTGDRERRVLIYRYQPGPLSVGRPVPAGHFEEIAALSPLHRALLEPPYLPDRPNIAELLEEAQ